MNKKTLFIIGGVLLTGAAVFLIYKTMQKRKEREIVADTQTGTVPINPGERASFGEDLKDVTKEAVTEVRDNAAKSLDNLMS